MIHLIAATITAGNIGSALAGAVLAGGTVAGVLDKRRKEVSETWRELAEAKSAQVDDQGVRLGKLEAKVELLESGFVRRMVSEVAAGVVQAIERSGR